MGVLIVEDEPYLTEAIRDGLRLEAIAADIAGDGDAALELLGSDACDIAVLDRGIPGPSGDEVVTRIVASGTGMPILMLSSRRNWFPPLPNRSNVVPNAYAPTTQASASAGPSPPASPAHATEPSPSLPGPPEGSAAPYNPLHRDCPEEKV